MEFTAAVLTQTGKDLEFVERIEVPVLKSGQVLVKLEFSGICHSQLMEASGKRGVDKYLPHLMGHEGTGVVIDKSSDVTRLEIGQQVILGWIKGQGQDVASTSYNSPIGKINAGAVTTFNELAVVSENRCYSLPENLTMQQGILLGCAFPTGMGVVINQACPKQNDVVGIIGLGGIGLSALVAAKQLNTKKIIAIDVNEEKLALARSFGASHCINANTSNVLNCVNEITDGKMLDYAIEAGGRCETIEMAFSLINPQSGECIFTSHPPSGEKIALEPHELICGKKITGSWGGGSQPERITQFVSKHKDDIPFSAFLSDVYDFTQVNQAMHDLKNQKVVRALLRFDF